MGVTLLGNIKIHEIAKKLNLNSKEVLARANSLGFNVKSHLSGVTEEVAKKIEDSFKNKDMKKSENKKTENKKDSNKKENTTRKCYY